jgi:hypothetical protein
MQRLALAAVALVASGALSGRAQESAQTIAMEVVLVYGSADDGGIDPDLIGMQEYLQRRLPMRFGTLQTVDAKRFELELGEPAGLPLPTGSSVRLLPIAIVGDRLHVHLEMPGVSTRLQVQNDRRVVLGGPRYKDGLVIVELTPLFKPEPASPGARVEQQPGTPQREPRTPSVERVGQKRPQR